MGERAERGFLPKNAQNLFRDLTTPGAGRDQMRCDEERCVDRLESPEQ